jgi:HSP20 family protein
MVVVRVAEKPYKGQFPSGNKFLDQVQNRGYYSFFPNESWTPNVNLYETDAAYVVCVDLAGVEKDKIEIEHVDGHLRLRGSRAVPSPFDDKNTRVRMHLMEIDHGHFARDVELPQDVEPDKINARHHNGLLWIEIPKSGK